MLLSITPTVGCGFLFPNVIDISAIIHIRCTNSFLRGAGRTIGFPLTLEASFTTIKLGVLHGTPLSRAHEPLTYMSTELN